MLKNKLTGEIVLDGTDTHLIFTAEAWTWIESATGMGTLQMCHSAANVEMSMTNVLVCVMSGMEAWNRRNGRANKKPTQAKALKLVEQTGGLMRAIKQLQEAFEFCPALGFEASRDAEEASTDEDPTIGDDSSDDVSPPEFARRTPGN